MIFLKSIGNFCKKNRGVLLSYFVTFLITYLHLIIVIGLENHRTITPLIWILLGVFIVLYAFQIRKRMDNKWWLLYLPLIYFLFVIGAYFVKVTLNLNNEKFDWTKFQHFWDFNFLIPLACLLLLALVFNCFSSYFSNEFINAFSLKKKRYDILVMSQIATMFIVTSNQLINSFLSNTLFLVEDIKKTAYAGQLLHYSLGMYVFFSLITYASAKGISHLIKNKPTPSLSVATSLLLAFIFNFTIQAGVTEKGESYGYYIASGATIFQILIIFACFMVIYITINRYLPATVFNIVLGVLISYINAEKFALRNEPFLIADFTWLNDIGFFKEYVSENALLLSIVGILWTIVILYYVRKKCLPGQIFKNWKQRLAVAVTIVVAFSETLSIFKNQEDGRIPEHIPVLSSVYNLYNVNWQGINANTRFQSLSFVWLKQLTITDIEKPANYSQKEIDKVYKKYTNLAGEINATRTENISDQTVIFILSESLADPARVPGVTLSAPVTPQIQQIQAGTTSGLMKSDGYGGGTANMEFQSLTGLPMYNFNDMISVLYTDVFPEMSYVPSISNAFDSKNRIAIHLSDATHYARNSVYTKLKFDKFIATSGSDDTADNVSTFGAYPSDASTYDNVLSEIDASQSQFFSVMTMQNHGPWFETNLSDITANGEGLTNDQNASLTNYARLLSYTDSSTAEFLQQLEGIDKKITVVFYGDHLPGIYPKSIFKDNPNLQYLTDYFIWSNHGTAKDDYPLVNSSDFPAELLAHTNSRVSPYYALLTEVLNKASVDKDKLDSDGKMVANDLKMIQYDLTEGKGYILNHSDFFEFE
ncbi:LTA synthase family protein [Streptococcus equinus]|uniref:Arylsulfatase n=1 Tax=Streptococcus equinus ATCC 9812 TaxID=525379 RepID=E8JP04_STREI|nr:LTA synthase family protein [Streptococcus equinus]EFW89051.1 arylsulfatase [Streptococcus equinus ATCC 9812]SUN57149.1 phosphoglycerol transferase [Streptococcus equinus]